LKPEKKPKRVHLATESGGRSRCRYTSRPSVRAKFVPLAEFLAMPVELRCVECAKEAEADSGEVMTFETTFYDPLLNSLREFYSDEKSETHGIVVISGEEYVRQLAAGSVDPVAGIREIKSDGQM